MKIPGALAITAGILAFVAPAAAAPPVGTPLSDTQLAEQRGGLQTPFGFDVGFGASVRTYVDGELVLETRLTWTDQGVQTERIIGAGEAVAGSPGSFTVTFPGATGGATEVRQDLSANRIANVVLNTANGRTIRQDTDITLVVPQLADLQRQMAIDRTTASLQNALGTALRSRSGP
jgi:hypothetical protein